MPDLLDMLDNLTKKEVKKTDLQKTPKNNAVKKNIDEKKSVSKMSFVGHTNYDSFEAPIEDTVTDICLTCKKRYKITQDKDMDKNEIIDWFSEFLTENKQSFTLDWLRGQKLTFESVNEMRSYPKRIFNKS